MCVYVCVHNPVYVYTYIHGENNSISVLTFFFRAASIVWMYHTLFNHFPICIRFFAVSHNEK